MQIMNRAKVLKKVSDWWYLGGVVGGLGYLFAIIYFLVSNNKNRLFSLLYLLGPIGAIILLIIFPNKDKIIYAVSFKLLVGSIVTIVIATIVLSTFFIFMPGLIHTYYMCYGFCY